MNSVFFEFPLYFLPFWAAASITALVLVPSVRFQKPYAGGTYYILVAALAAIARYSLSPKSVFHENAHAYEFIRSSISGDGYFYHGPGFYAFYYPILKVFGPKAEVIFTGNLILSSLSCLLISYIASRLFNSRHAGLFAGLLYAAWPSLIRLAYSESPFNLAIFLGLASFSCTIRARESGNFRFALAAMSLSTIAIQVRPIMALWVAMATIAAIYGLRERQRLGALGMVGLAALGTLFLIPWISFRILDLAQHGLPRFFETSPGSFAISFFRRNNLLFDISWTPLVAILVGAPAVIFGIYRYRSTTLVFIIGILALSWFAIPTSGDTLPAQIRLQSPLSVIAAVICANVINIPILINRKRLQTIVVLIVGFVCLANTVLVRANISALYNPQLEYSFLVDAAPTIPSTCTLLIPDRHMANGVISTEFPYWEYMNNTVVRNSTLKEDIAGVEDRCILQFIGITCYTYTWQELSGSQVPRTERDECSVPGFRRDPNPTASLTFRNFPYTDYLLISREELTIGFYRLDPTNPTFVNEADDAADVSDGHSTESNFRIPRTF